MGEVLRNLLLVAEGLCCLILVGLILLQRSKNEGLVMFGSGGGDSLFGARAGNVLTRLTIYFGVGFMVITLLLGMLYANGESKSLMDSVPVPAAAQPLEGEFEIPAADMAADVQVPEAVQETATDVQVPAAAEAKEIEIPAVDQPSVAVPPVNTVPAPAAAE